MRTVVPARARNMPAKSTAASFLHGRSAMIWLVTSQHRGVTHTRQSPSTCLRGMKNITPAVVRRVRGMFIRKIQRQESADLDEMAPPMTGPMPLARATTAP